MSVFEDLIEELKEENLLEETVIKVHSRRHAEENLPSTESFTQTPAATINLDAKEQSLTQEADVRTPNYDTSDLSEFAPVEFSSRSDEPADDPYADETRDSNVVSVGESLVSGDNFDFDELVRGPVDAEEERHQQVVRPRKALGEKEYFRKRAMDEVTGLQMVEHVLSGIEREQMKVAPRPYDDLPVKLALHDFLQVAHETNSTEHAQSEFKLMQETENWYSALSHRDRNVSVAHLRRFCETTRPALSAQALIALTRFYRNSPYSEAVRSKFDLVLTRLFSREIEFEQRELLLEHHEMIQQLKELYADWSSIQVYAENEQSSEILLATAKFADFVNEAERTVSFDELLTNDFFSRLRKFKESCQENFFAPPVTVAAVESNIKIGNRYIELLNREKQSTSNQAIEEKYGFLHDQAVSDATGKTFELVELLNEHGSAGKGVPVEIVEVSVKEEERSAVRAPKKPRSKIYSANGPLIMLTVLTVAICGGMYFWAEYQTQSVPPATSSVTTVPLANSDFKDYIQTAKVVDETFFGITLASWESMNSERKQDFLKRILALGPEKRFKKVQLVNTAGKSVGFASADKVEVYNQ